MTWQPGQSGNPGGRPKENEELKALARTFTAEAIERLAHWMRSDEPRASVAAVSVLLDRGYGKPAQAMTGEGGEGPIELVVRWGGSKKS